VAAVDEINEFHLSLRKSTGGIAGVERVGLGALRIQFVSREVRKVSDSGFSGFTTPGKLPANQFFLFPG
jgi:hypothetical protein